MGAEANWFDCLHRQTLVFLMAGERTLWSGVSESVIVIVHLLVSRSGQS